MAFLAELPAKRSAIGTPEHEEGLRATERLISARLRELGYEPREQEYEWTSMLRRAMERQRQQAEEPKPVDAKHNDAAPRDELEAERSAPAPVWRNIIVTLDGTDLKNEVLIVGAHFDAVPTSPGADDNGTGTAALMELARVLKDVPRRRTIMLAFLNLEEVGLFGATQLAREVRAKTQSGEIELKGMISLEMLGYFTDEPGSQKSPVGKIEREVDGRKMVVFDPPTVGDFIAIAGVSKHRAFSQRLGDLMRESEPAMPVLVADFFPIAPPDFLRSDHGPFLLAGLPAVMITDTSNFRNPNYHKAGDTVSTIDGLRFTRVVRGVAGAVERMAR
jgi:hypothetical protein